METERMLKNIDFEYRNEWKICIHSFLHYKIFYFSDILVI